MNLNLIDRLVNYINPKRGLERIRAKTALSFMQESGYITAGSNRRSVRKWKTSGGTANQDTLPKVKKSRESSRDLSYNTPIARGGLMREARNAIGPGLLLQSRIDYEILGLTSEAADKWQRNTERRFHNWAKSKNADFSKRVNFYQQQWQVTYNTSLSGDVFAVLTTVEINGKRKSAVKLIEADDVTNPISKSETFDFAGGIESDQTTKEPKYIHVRKINPGTLLTTDISHANFVCEKIPFKDSTGRIRVLHIYHQERIGQSRGMPLFAPVVELLKNVSRLTESELMAAIISSFFTVFLKTTSPQGIMPGPTGNEQIDSEKSVQDQASQALEMGVGNIIELQTENQSIEIAEAKRPNGAFEPFFNAMMKQLGSCIEIPAEQLMLYFSSSYTAFRGAIQEAWKFFKGSRHFNVTEFSQPVYEDWLETEILEGRIVAPGFFEDDEIRAAWCGSHWVGPAQGQVDPVKETIGAELRIKNFLSNYEDEYASINGNDWEGAVRRQSRERRLVKDVIDKTYNIDSSKSQSYLDDEHKQSSEDDEEIEESK